MYCTPFLSLGKIRKKNNERSIDNRLAYSYISLAVVSLKENRSPTILQ